MKHQPTNPQKIPCLRMSTRTRKEYAGDVQVIIDETLPDGQMIPEFLPADPNENPLNRNPPTP